MIMLSEHPTPQDCVEQAQKILAHAWMVRTFIKHSEEVEDFPELMQMARTVFDVAMALESKRDSPREYFRMLEKKIGKLRKSALQFEQDAPEASSHTNFQQAVISLNTSVEELDFLLQQFQSLSSISTQPRNPHL